MNVYSVIETSFFYKNSCYKCFECGFYDENLSYNEYSVYQKKKSDLLWSKCPECNKFNPIFTGTPNVDFGDYPLI